jgi:hypothetical protein
MPNHISCTTIDAVTSSPACLAARSVVEQLLILGVRGRFDRSARRANQPRVEDGVELLLIGAAHDDRVGADGLADRPSRRRHARVVCGVEAPGDDGGVDLLTRDDRDAGERDPVGAIEAGCLESLAVAQRHRLRVR